jgi:hypothetical protein
MSDSLFNNDKIQAIEEALMKKYSSNNYVPFDLADYVDNPGALARINAGITQEELENI